MLFGSAEKSISAYLATEIAEEQSKMKCEIELLLKLALPD
ncbi:hypothetical protein [Pantoea agglomerans]